MACARLARLGAKRPRAGGAGSEAAPAMGSAGGDADGRTGDDEGTRRWCRTGRRSCDARSKRRRRPTRDIGRVTGVSAPAHIDTCHTVSTRYGDLDPNGHVNNVAIAQLYEDARARLSRELDLNLQKPWGGSFPRVEAASPAALT
jgi:hypothetical protein